MLGHLLLLLILPITLAAQMLPNQMSAPSSVETQNRILAEINGKPITVLDLKKQMDVVFRQEFSEYLDNPVARFQFYENSWKQVFEDLIDRELVLADAERMGMTVTNGDIRQEMIESFGPNVMATLDEIDLPFSQAWEMIETDITIRRMTSARAHFKAYAKVHPKDIREAYSGYVTGFDSTPVMTYRVITVRTTEEELGEEIASSIFTQLEGTANIEDAVAVAMSQTEQDPSVSTKLSDTFIQKASEISPNYLTTLSELKPGTVSKPTMQKSRATGKAVWRLFFLEDLEKCNPKTFAELEEEINGHLLQKSIAEETIQYKSELREQFNITPERIAEMIPSGFRPFSLL